MDSVQFDSWFDSEPQAYMPTFTLAATKMLFCGIKLFKIHSIKFHKIFTNYNKIFFKTILHVPFLECNRIFSFVKPIFLLRILNLRE